MPKKHIGHLILARRKQLGFRADDVAALCNVTRSLVYKWEKQRFIMWKQLRLLSAALQIPLKQLQAENDGKLRHIVHAKKPFDNAMFKAMTRNQLTKAASVIKLELKTRV